MGAQTYVPIEILDYVQTHAPPDDSPFGISQKELARALGYHPCSMSRPLEALVDGGLLTAQRRLVREGIRKQITYRLTAEGRARLREGDPGRSLSYRARSRRPPTLSSGGAKNSRSSPRASAERAGSSSWTDPRAWARPRS